ncbi:MAG: hypothetical protein ABW168_06340, partial [Sedimenticola sp.]
MEDSRAAKTPAFGERRNQMKRILTLVVLLFAAIGSSSYAATTATWISGNGLYSAASNWDGGVVPKNSATETFDIVIDNSADVSLDDLTSITINQLTLMSGNTFKVDGTGSMLNVLNTVSFDGTSVYASDGGVLDLSAATSYTGTDGYNLDRTLSAADAGSVLDLSSLTTLVRNSGGANDLHIKALAGGVVDLSGLSEFTDNGSGNGALHLSADGVDSKLDISGVTQLTSANIAALKGGEVTGQLINLTSSRVTKYGNTSTLDLSQLVDGTDSTFIAEDGAIIDLHTANIDRTSLIVQKGYQGAGGGRITTDVTSYTGTDGYNLDRTLSAA